MRGHHLCFGAILLNHLPTPTKQGIKMDTVENSHLQKNFQGKKKNILEDTVKVGLKDIQDSSEPQISMIHRVARSTDSKKSSLFLAGIAIASFMRMTM